MQHALMLLLTIAGTTPGIPPDRRDFHDTIASSGQFPFVVAIDDPVDDSPEILQPPHDCPGVIINKNWVLTAARYNIVDYFQHDNFTITSVKNNIALAQIDGEFEFSSLVQPTEYAVPEENTTNCVEIGWEYLTRFEYLEELGFINLTAVDYETCRNIVGDTLADEYLKPAQMCSLRPEGGAACRGNSGGPLVCDGKLVGTGSFAIPSCDEGYPNVYEKPTAYVDWIDRTIRDNTLVKVNKK